MANDLSGIPVAIDLTECFKPQRHRIRGAFSKITAYKIPLNHFKILIGLNPQDTLADFPIKKEGPVKSSIKQDAQCVSFHAKHEGEQKPDTIAENTSIVIHYEPTTTEFAILIKLLRVDGRQIAITQQNMQDVAKATQAIISHIQNGEPLHKEALISLSDRVKAEYSKPPSIAAHVMARLWDNVPNAFKRSQ